MLVRLAFSIAIQVDAEILLIDEVLAVGDAGFQQKCFEEFFRLKREGKTIVFVSHDMDSVERFCDRAMLMERGRMIEIGEPRAIARAYHELNFGQLDPRGPAQASGRHGGRAIVDGLVRERRRRADRRRASQEDALSMCFEVRIAEDLDDPVFAATLRTEVGHTIIVARSDERRRLQRHASSAGETVVVRFAIAQLADRRAATR